MNRSALPALLLLAIPYVAEARASGRAAAVVAHLRLTARARDRRNDRGALRKPAMHKSLLISDM